MNLKTGRAIAGQVCALLRPACHRIEIAGSIRREKAEVRDIDLVILPHSAESLNRAICAVVQSGELQFGPKQGPKHKSFWYDLPPVYAGEEPAAPLKIELWIANEDNYGNTLVLRTGDEFWNKGVFVTARDGGLLTGGLYHQDGYLWRSGGIGGEPQKLPCPEEADYFRFAGLPYVEPANRNLTAVLRLKGRC